MTIETVSTARAFGGVQGVYKHQSTSTGTEMTFSVFLPPQAEQGPRPVVTYLSGLTCTHANVMEKGDYRRAAAELGLIVVCPDTSPRGEDVPDDPAFDFGQGAGFYLDAVRRPWAAHYRMETYVTEELHDLVLAQFAADPGRQGIMGHSMGGHGALTLALRHPEIWKSVSAFAPISNPTSTPWGRKAFLGYLGDDEAGWREHDAAALIREGRRLPEPLIDFGLDDPFFDRELDPHALEAASKAAGQPLTLRRQPGYDHSYFFVSTFMADHLEWHARHLG
jgi:S-formylglutathione hydrolase